MISQNTITVECDGRPIPSGSVRIANVDLPMQRSAEDIEAIQHFKEVLVEFHCRVRGMTDDDILRYLSHPFAHTSTDDYGWFEELADWTHANGFQLIDRWGTVLTPYNFEREIDRDINPFCQWQEVRVAEHDPCRTSEPCSLYGTCRRVPNDWFIPRGNDDQLGRRTRTTYVFDSGGSSTETVGRVKELSSFVGQVYDPEWST
jgi:hypothetical protein